MIGYNSYLGKGGENMFFGFGELAGIANHSGEPMIPLSVVILGIIVLSVSMFFIGYNTGKSDAIREQSCEWKSRFEHSPGDIPPGP